MNRLSLALTLAILSWLSASPTVARAANELGAESAVLLDAHTGRILWEHNAHARKYPASMTKVLTALVYAERELAGAEAGKALEQRVSFSRAASEVGDSPIGFLPGERLTARDQLHLLLMRSDNKAAHALAERSAGSVARFVGWMNRRAQELGARNSHFVNPHGLHHSDHYSTAYDIGLLACAALRNPIVAEIAQTPTYLLQRTAVPARLRIENRNKLLERRSDATGLKTGYTRPAGRCFVGTARRGDMELVAVVMKSPDMWSEASALLDYGFATFTASTLARRSEVVTKVQVVNGERECPATPARDVIVAVRPDERGRLRPSYHMLASRAPIHRGQKLGRLTVELDSSQIAETDLIAAEDVKERLPLAAAITHNPKLLVGLILAGTIMAYGTLAQSTRARRRRVASRR